MGRAVPASRARPIGHWQHWNWQHFHIGNIPNSHSPLPTPQFPTPHSPLPNSPLPTPQFPIPNSQFPPSPLHPTFALFAFFVAKKHSPRPPTLGVAGFRGRPHSGWRASMPANPQRASAPACPIGHWQHFHIGNISRAPSRPPVGRAVPASRKMGGPRSVAASVGRAVPASRAPDIGRAALRRGQALRVKDKAIASPSAARGAVLQCAPRRAPTARTRFAQGQAPRKNLSVRKRPGKRCPLRPKTFFNFFQKPPCAPPDNMIHLRRSKTRLGT